MLEKTHRSTHSLCTNLVQLQRRGQLRRQEGEEVLVGLFFRQSQPRRQPGLEHGREQLLELGGLLEGPEGA